MRTSRVDLFEWRIIRRWKRRIVLIRVIRCLLIKMLTQMRNQLNIIVEKKIFAHRTLNKSSSNRNFFVFESFLLLDNEILRNRITEDFDRVFDRNISAMHVYTCVLKRSREKCFETSM
jgi:hypothetical protein